MRSSSSSTIEVRVVSLLRSCAVAMSVLDSTMRGAVKGPDFRAVPTSSWLPFKAIIEGCMTIPGDGPSLKGIRSSFAKIY